MPLLNLGFLVAVSVVIVGSAFSLQIGEEKHTALSAIALTTSIGFLTACYFLYQSAKPVDWHFVGNAPNKWLADIEKEIPLHDALAEQCAFYDRCLRENNHALHSAAKQVDRAPHVFTTTLILNGLASV